MPVTAAPQAVAGSGRFVVNLGSYANAANAEALRQRLAARGYPLRSERIEVDGKPAQRLRAGPFRSRAEAEAAALRLNQAEPGAKFSVAELEAAEAVAGAAPRVAQGFAVQLGAFKDEADALALRDRLRGGGFAAYTERASTDAGPLWRVRAGPELQRERAEALQKRIRDLLKLEGIVVSHP
jgi:DedD protein